jgi:hypothetical protein
MAHGCDESIARRSPGDSEARLARAGCDSVHDPAEELHVQVRPDTPGGRRAGMVGDSLDRFGEVRGGERIEFRRLLPATIPLVVR